MSIDVIIMGGGLAGASAATKLCEQGRKVRVLERETKFKDRVRGENMLPWGVGVAQRLGMLDDLIAAGAQKAPDFVIYAGPETMSRRPLPQTTPAGQPCINMYHPDLQETVLRRAIAAGADVRRGAVVEGIEVGAGHDPRVTYTENGERRTETARLVIAADGRSSKARTWGGFTVERDPELLSIAGTLLEDTSVPDDATHLVVGEGLMTLLAPLGNRRARTYVVYPSVMGRRSLSGDSKIPEFLQLCRATGAPAAWFDGAQVAGPLAEFVSADSWVESPAKHGLALIGDAAASTDPSFGCGLSLSLWDVEHLTDALGSTEDSAAALARYAREHDVYYGSLHRALGWMTQLFWTPPPEGDARRQKVMPRMFADPTGFPDPIGQGPDGPSDENARRLVMGEA